MLESPECFSQTAETRLDFITDANNFFLPENFIYFLIEVERRNNLTSTAEHILSNKSTIILIDSFSEILLILLNWIY
jgi:hypothetical protein